MVSIRNEQTNKQKKAGKGLPWASKMEVAKIQKLPGHFSMARECVFIVISLSNIYTYNITKSVESSCIMNQKTLKPVTTTW